MATGSGNRNSRIKIINDGSTDDADKLGAIGDINLVMTREELANRRPDRRRGRQSFQRTAGGFRRARERLRSNPGDLRRGRSRSDQEIQQHHDSIRGGRHHPVRRETGRAEKHADRNRALLFFARAVPLFTTYIAAGKQSGPAWPLHPVALPAQAGEDLSDQRHLVRYRQQRDAGGSEPDFREVRPGRTAR